MERPLCWMTSSLSISSIRSVSSMASPIVVSGSSSANSSPPQPGDNVRFPNPVLQQPGDLPEHLVAGIVAIGVVNLLEVVQVHHHHGQRVGMALGVAEQLSAKLVEGAAVVKTGQLVFQGCGPGLLVSLLKFQFHLLAQGDIGGNFQPAPPGRRSSGCLGTGLVPRAR